MSDEKVRAYKLPVKTCRQIDYLNLVTGKEKTQIIASAVDLLFLLNTVLPDDLKDMIASISSSTSDDDLFEMIRSYMLQIINEPFVKEAL